MMKPKFFSILIWTGLLLISFTLLACESEKKSDFKTDFALAFNAANAGDYEEAVEMYSKSLEYPGISNKDKAHAFYNRGYSHDGLKQYQKAIADYSQSIQLKPDYKEAYDRRALSYENIEQFDQAIADISHAIDLNPNGLIYNVNNFKTRGRFEFYQSRFDKAAEDFSQVVSFNNDIYAMIWLFLANKRQGKDGKQELKTQANSVDLNNWPGPLVSVFLGEKPPDNLIGQALSEDNKIDNERKCEAFFYLGQYFIIQGDKNKAKELFQKAIDTGVTNFMEYAGAKVEIKRN